jgi:hypothetical protein
MSSFVDGTEDGMSVTWPAHRPGSRSSLARAGDLSGSGIALATDVGAGQLSYLDRMSLRRLVRAHGDQLLAAAVATLAQVELWTGGEYVADGAVLVALALAMTVPLAWRVRFPLLALAPGARGELSADPVTNPRARRRRRARGHAHGN